MSAVAVPERARLTLPELFADSRVMAARQVRKNLRRETDALEFWTKVLNIGTMPVLVAISGLGLAVLKSRRKPRLDTTRRPPPRRSPPRTEIPAPTEAALT